MPLETEGGDSICTTRSMAPMSMPSSSEDVATRPRKVPILRRSSISLRWSAATLPWWARTRVSPASSLTAPEMRSARRRLLTKMRVEVWARTSSSSLGWMALQMEGPAGEGGEVGEAGHIVERDFDAEVDALGRAGVDDGDVAVARGGVGGFEF